MGRGWGGAVYNFFFVLHNMIILLRMGHGNFIIAGISRDKTMHDKFMYFDQQNIPLLRLKSMAKKFKHIPT